FHPLEVILSATIYAAQALYEKLDYEPPFCTIRPGKLADLVIVEENPLQNLKTLYGNGAIRLNGVDDIQRVGGVKYTIKDGIVYDAKKLLKDVRKMVDKQAKEQREKEWY